MKFILLFCLLVFPFSGAAAQERFLRPVDEAPKDASFLAFRTKLVAAVKRRDAAYVLSVVDPRIRNTFGDDDGIRYFKRFWKIETRTSKFWDEFAPVIENGGVFSTEGGIKTFAAPYTYTSFPADLDDFAYAAVVGSDVNLREQPSLQAKTLARLSYNVVKVDFDGSVQRPGDELYRYSWLKVETLGGLKGFVKEEFVRTALDYRAIFEKKGGRWKLTAFVAGD
jgi:hypothetical protein